LASLFKLVFIIIMQKCSTNSKIEDNRREREYSISVVIPTLNSSQTLDLCLRSIMQQKYSGSIEVIISDGGSKDDTIDIAKRWDCKIVHNPRVTGEAGKAEGVRHASGDIIAFIDSDNILPCDNWFQLMVRPFDDNRIVASEPIMFTYRRSDSALTRYCALLGMNDPLCYFLKNYDRLSLLSGKWTGLNIKYSDKGEYIEVFLEKDNIPTIGANGFLIRRNILEKVDVGDYLFDIDLVHNLVERGHVRFAKVRVGIVHLYGRGILTFSRKQLRRVRDFAYFKSMGLRTYPWSAQRKRGLAIFIIYCITIIPLVFQAIKGYMKCKDPAWFLHVPACVLTFIIYSLGYVEGKLRPTMHTRLRWSQ